MFLLMRVAFVLLLLTGSRAQRPDQHDRGEAPGPCDKASTQLELNQCTAEQYKKADASLNALYKEIGSDLARNNDAAAVGKLKAAERVWLKYRDLHCDAARHQFKGGSMSPMIWADCMTGVTLNRIQELKFAYPIDGQPRI